MILRICNRSTSTVLEGGTAREAALTAFADSVGGDIQVIQDSFFYRSKPHRLARVGQLMRQIYRSPHRIIVLLYPSYPFFWKHKVTPWFFVSILFSYLLFAITRIRGKRVVIDVADLPLYQYQDLQLPMEMSPRVFHTLDKVIFTLADELWFASEAFEKLAQAQYDLPAYKTKTVLNGALRVEPVAANLPQSQTDRRPFRFVYAGTMNASRDLEWLLDAFIGLHHSYVELHLCGIQGEWITDRYHDPRMKYHGSLTYAESLGIIRECDVGIIPYPERGYFNMVFPSKFPLYIVGGVMLLGTETTELARCIDQWRVGLHAPSTRFAQLMSMCAENQPLVESYRRSVDNCKEDFYAEVLYSHALSGALMRFGFDSLMPGYSV